MSGTLPERGDTDSPGCYFANSLHLDGLVKPVHVFAFSAVQDS